MRNNLVGRSITLIFAFIVIVIGNYVIIAQNVVTGDWTANANSEKAERAGKIHISFERKMEKGRNQHSSSFEYSELQGLSREQAQNGNVNFRLIREAGTIDCVGSFTNGKGSGTFTFTSDPNYVSAMRARGFDFESPSARNRHDNNESKLLSAALLNVTVAIADDLNSANFGKLEVDDLFKAAIFKVDGRFMAEMKASGFPNLSMEDLVKARIFKIDADYVRQVHEMGFSDRGFESLVKFRIFKVTPEYLNELRAAGLSDLDSEAIVKCRIFKIDADFIRKAKAENPNATVEDMVKMKLGLHKLKITI